MATVVRLPLMSDTMEEGVIVQWMVKVGDQVKAGDFIAEVETDKATMELENFVNGTILHLNAEEGETIAVNSIVAIIGEKGEDYQNLLGEAETKDPENNSIQEKKDVSNDNTKTETAAASTSQSTNNRLKASPLARKMAQEKGIDLNKMSGSGENGRIVKKDIENYTPDLPNSNTASSLIAKESYKDIKVTQMRKTIAKRLAESKFTAPHFYLTMEIEMDRIIEGRKILNDYSDVKISMNDIIVKACAIALTKHPMVNASWMGTHIRQNNHVHVGVAVAVEDGLLVPVVKHADKKSLKEISQEVKEKASKARNKELQPSEWEGNTFTVSNLGMFGIDEFTAIINPPDSCILAVGGVKQQFVPKNGQPSAVSFMKVTLSCDHRVVDGVTGSQFLQTLKSTIEEPFLMLL